MAVLPIVKGQDNTILRTKTKKVPKVTKEVKKLLKDMEETMKAAEGVGLAAPQIGSDLRVCIAVIHDRATPLVNPEITKQSKETAVDQEGCLSLPGIWLDIERPREISLTYFDLTGKKRELQLKDFSARVVQHEVDHLEGILITDYSRKENINPIVG